MLRGPVTPELDEYLNNELGHNSGADITIGNDVWIGTGSMILPGVKIGDGAVIAAGSVVTRKVEPYTVVGGYPAKLMYYRFSENIIADLLEIRWWDWPSELIEQSSNLLWSNDIQKFIDYAKILGQIMPIELIKITENGTKVFIRNNTSNIIKVNTKFTDVATDESICHVPLDMLPDVEYWVSAPPNSKTRHFIVVEKGTIKILLKTKTSI
jgi:carbonic anhydrase/acetyltransferase-like protein (isoleucine patch superfamily)